MSIGKKIKHLRIIHNLTQKELAEIIGVKPSTVSKYENDERHISIHLLLKIADALHCDLNYFSNEYEDNNSYTFVVKNISETTLYKFIALYKVEKKNIV